MTLEAQESAQADDTTAPAVADETSSPEVTDGASSSDAAVGEEKDVAASVVGEFLEKYGAKDGDSEKEEPEVEPEAPKTERKAEPNEKDDGDGEFRLSDDQFKALPDGVKKRIGHLNARAKRAERQLTEVEQEVTAAKQDREALGALRRFAEENRMSQEDVATALGAFAKFRTGDYRGFLAELSPILDEARQSAGETFAPDLQKQVEDGYLTEDAARELTKARLEAKRAKEEASLAQRQAQSVTEQSRRAATIDTIRSAVNAREAELRSTDPDYAQKAPAVKSFMEYALKRGAIPRTKEEAIQMVNEAHAYAATLAPPKPAPAPTAPRPTASSAPRGKPVPTSLLDAFDQNPPAAARA